MSTFEYVALDTLGRTREGVVRAANERAARQELQRRKLAPVKLSPAAAAAAAAGAAAPAAKLSARTLALVTRQLATLAAVAPLEEALRTLALQAERPAVRNTLLQVHGGVLEGRRLADAMARQGKSFPPLYRAMIAAGEASGSLPAILERLADLLEREQLVRSRVLTATIYPALLACVAVLVVMALMTFVVPRVVEQFDSIGQQLPLLTRIVIALSEGLRFAGLPLLAVAVGGGFVFARALRNPAVRLGFDARLLALPLIGRMLRDLHAARLARTLATMIASGLPLLEGLVITARTVQNQVLKQATEAMAVVIREGGSLSAAMRRSEVLPPLLVYMTASGESSGRLEIMLERAAEYLEREFNTFTSVALSLLEPVIIIVMGAVVTAIVLSILLPILQINTLAYS